MATDNDVVVVELRKIARVLALVLVREQTQTESISLLSRGSFSGKEIAEILGTTPSTVRARLAEVRKKSKKRQKTGKAEVKK